MKKRSFYSYLPGIIILLMVALLAGCEEDEFNLNIDHLTHTPWGIPQIIEPGLGHIDLDAPTIFDPSGFVTIGSSRTDFWSIRGSRNIFLEQAREDWHIHKLTPDTLIVTKTSYPDGTYIARCLYQPLTK